MYYTVQCFGPGDCSFFTPNGLFSLPSGDNWVPDGDGPWVRYKFQRPTVDGAAMWFGLEPAGTGFYPDPTTIALFSCEDPPVELQRWDGLTACQIISRGTTYQDRIWVSYDGGSGLVCSGGVIIYRTDGTSTDVGTPQCYLNSQGFIGMQELVEGDPTSDVSQVVIYTRTRAGFGTNMYWAELNTTLSQNWPDTGGNFSVFGAGTVGQNNLFFSGANRVTGRVYFTTQETGVPARSFYGWVDPATRVVTNIRSHADTFIGGGLVGWDGNLYAQDTVAGRSTWIIKMDKDGVVLDDVDIGTTLISLACDKHGILYVCAGTGDIRFVYRVRMSDMVILDCPIQLIDKFDDLMGEEAFEGRKPFVTRSTPTDSRNIRVAYGSTRADQVACLLHFDGTNGSVVITDEAGHIFQVNGNAALETATVKFGTAALGTLTAANGTDCVTQSSLEYADPDFIIGAQSKFTIRGWAYFDSIGGTQILTGKVKAGNDTPFDNLHVEWAFYLTNSTTLNLYYGYRGHSQVVRTFTVPVISTATWHFFVMQRVAGNNIYVSVDGVWSANVYTETTALANITKPLTFGGFETAAFAGPFNGKLDEWEIIRNTAVYDTASNFTPPTAPFSL